MARWLDEREATAWIEVAGLATRLPAALDSQLQRDADLSFFEYMVLSMLDMSDERTRRMSDLAALTSASLSRLSHVVSRLEKRDYVKRSRCKGGVGRATNATLTDAGHAKVVEAAPGHVAAVRELLIDALTPADLDALIDVGSRVRPRLDAAAPLPATAPNSSGRPDAPGD
ncbi:MAG: MarR family winged helix-turn-helix transcriptional regulator [Ilumatobacter sp.]